MAIMSIRSRSHIKVSMVLTRADHLFIHNYIRSLQNIIYKINYWSGRSSNPCPTACVYDALATEPHRQLIYIYNTIYIYIYIYI